MPDPLRRELRSLRLLVVWLGALWIVLGLAIMCFAGVLFFTPNADPLFILRISGPMGVVGLIWVLLGIITCRQRLFAIYAGLIFSYLHLAVSAFNFSLCTGLFFFALVLHAHRVLRWANILRNKGIPLATRLQDIKPLP